MSEQPDLLDVALAGEAKRCGGCRKFSLPIDEKLSQFGFGRCAYLPHWRTLSQHAACTFDPSRHEAAA